MEQDRTVKQLQRTPGSSSCLVRALLPCCPPAPDGTFIVAKMFWRSLNWMGWVGLVAELVPLPELGTGLGLVTEAAAGTDGAGVTRVEEVVEDGVTAADWLRELPKRIRRINSLQKPPVFWKASFETFTIWKTPTSFYRGNKQPWFPPHSPLNKPRFLPQQCKLTAQ